MLRRLFTNGGIPSICSAHPVVLKETLTIDQSNPVLIESTCNQVNQFGGYTGMTPKQFAAYVQNAAAASGFPVDKIILGGDHLGPVVWQNEPSESAMQKSMDMVKAYVDAGYTKIHLDCSIPLADDPAGSHDVELIAKRAAQLVSVCEAAASARAEKNNLVYVIGTEVPIPGGATAHEEGVSVTQVSDLSETIEVHRKAFFTLGLQQAWDRVIAVVVQPGVEFGDDFVLPYQSDATRDLSSFIENQGLVYEAHSTDYQTNDALRQMVHDHFAILKVGPALTFAYREAIFALAFMEDELIHDDRSNIVNVLDRVMVQNPIYWKKYYPGSESEQAFKRKFSLSDRSRYYWVQPEIQQSLQKLKTNLNSIQIPYSLMSQYASADLKNLLQNNRPLTAENIVSSHVSLILSDYWDACNLLLKTH